MRNESESEVCGRRRRLLIVDGHAYAYRAFHAIRELSGPDGTPTNAIYGFIRMFTKLQSHLQPTHVVVIWDGGLAAERTQALPEYKAQRPSMPRELEQQLDGIESYLKAAQVTSLQREGIEADDWIAALARVASAAGIEVVIASSDKDFMQLVAEDVGLINPNDKSECIWTREQVLAKTAVEPEQIVDWLSLIGDHVDNIPGVPGVGPKTAADLLRQFGSIDALYLRIDEVKSDRIRNGLAASEQIVRRNQKLIRLCPDLPIELQLDELSVREPNCEALRHFYACCGFRGLLRDLDAFEERQGLLL